MNLSLSFVIFFPSSSCIIDLVDFPNFVKKFLPLGLQGFLRNIWNYSRLKWLNEILRDVYLVHMYFPNVNYWAFIDTQVSPAFDQSVTLLLCLFLLIIFFFSDNSSKYGNGQPW